MNTIQLDSSDFNSLVLDCEDENFEQLSNGYIDSIKILETRIVNFVSISKLARANKEALVHAVHMNDSTFQAAFKNEADLIFWSYGTASINGERSVPTNCYFLDMLKKRIILLNFMYQKLQGTVPE